jgi:tetratricopeptide (TPR) repeat protein
MLSNQETPFAVKLLNAAMYFMLLAIPLSFYLLTYDSCQIKITILQIGGAVMLACWLFRALAEKKFTKEWLAWNLPVVLYFIWGLVAFLHSPYKSTSSVDELIRLVYYFGIYLVASDYFSQDNKMRTAANLLVTAATAAIIYGFMQYFNYDPFAWSQAFGTRMFSTFGNPNFYAAFLVLTAPFIMSYFFRVKSKPAKVFLALLFAANIISLFTTGSKGGWLGIAGSSVCFTMLMVKFVVKNPKLKTYLVAFTIFAMLFSTFGVYQYSKKRFDSILFRLLTWRSTIEMINLHPIIGNGLGTFRLIYPAYRDRVIFRIEGKHQTETQHPENEYLEIASDQGAIGLGLYFWMLITIFSRGLIRLKQYVSIPVPVNKKTSSAEPAVPDRVFYLMAFIAGLFGLLAHNLFCVNLRFVSSGFFLWVFLGVVGGAYAYGPVIMKKDEKPAGYIGPLKALIFILTAFCIVIYCRFFLADYYHNLAIGYSKLRMWDDAIPLYEDSIKLNPYFAMNRYFLGNVYNDRWQPGDAQKALAKYEEVLKMAPNYVMIHYQQGVVYQKMGAYREALEEFGQALKLDPVYSQTYFRVGLIYIELKDLDKALFYFEESAKLEPTMPDIYINIANVYFLQNKIAEAEANYQKALSLDSNNLNGHRNLAMLYLRTNRKSEALREFKAARQLAPNDPEITKVINSISQ